MSPPGGVLVCENHNILCEKVPGQYKTQMTVIMKYENIALIKKLNYCFDLFTTQETTTIYDDLLCTVPTALCTSQSSYNMM